MEINRLKYPRHVKSKLVALGLFIAAMMAFAIPASGITFGREVTNASIAYPSVVSIWTSEDAESDAYLMCSGTLITNRIVLTAAHCVNSTDLYYVQYGADQLYEETELLEVAATWKNPRFSERQLVNDTGLLLLKDPIPGAVTTRLPSVSEIKSMQANKNVKYEIVGWGKDQNGESASYLRKAPVDDQTNFMKKAKWWRNDVWIAVGKWNSKEKVFAGSCNGDSGGPLFATVGSKTILAGITSWGAEDCETAQPSIYVRLSYYINEINKVGIPTLLVNETKQNRALPSVVVEPRIIGTPRTGSVLSCDTGQWSSNTTNVSYSWSGSGVPYGFSGSSLNVTANTSNSPKEFTCLVRGSNSNGYIERRLSVTQNPPPSNISRPTISNMPTIAFNGNVSISCNPGTFNFSTSVSNEWWVGDSSYFEPTTRIGTGNTLVFGASSFTAWGGKYLYCKTVATGDGGASGAMSSSSLIPGFQKPIIKTYPNINGLFSYQSPVIGTVATCNGWSWSNVMTTESVGWYINSSDSFSGATLLQNGASITLTQSFLETYKSRYLICAVTGTNQGGTQIMYDTHYLYYYPTVTPTPVAPTPVAPTPVAPTPTVTPKVTATTLSFSGGINSIKVGDVITCGVTVSSGTVSRVRFVWRNSNIAADVSYSSTGGFREVTFIDQYTSQASITLNVTSSVLQNIDGLYLDCLAYVDFSSGATGSGYTKLKMPATTSTPTPTPTPTPTSTVVAPSQPAITSIVPTTTSFTINWAVPTSNGGSPITQYWAYVEGANGATVSYCSTTGALSCTATGLSPNTSYKVIVSAWNSAGGVNRSSGDQNSPRTSATTSALPVDTLNPNVQDGSSEMVSGWTGYLGMTPVLSLIAVDNVGVRSVSVSLYVNDALINTSQATLYSGSNTNGVWRATLNFSGSDYIGNWQIRATATDLSGNASTQRLLREIPVSKQ